MKKENLAIELQEEKEYRPGYLIVRFGIPESASYYGLALLGNSASPDFVRHVAQTAFQSKNFALDETDFNPAHTPVYLAHWGSRYFFEVMIEAGKAERLKNHTLQPTVCRNHDELRNILEPKPAAKYTDFVFTHPDRIVQQAGESVPDAIQRIALDKFGPARMGEKGLLSSDFNAARRPEAGNGGRLILHIEESKAEALENTGHKDIVLPYPPRKKPDIPRIG